MHRLISYRVIRILMAELIFVVGGGSRGVVCGCSIQRPGQWVYDDGTTYPGGIGDCRLELDGSRS